MENYSSALVLLPVINYTWKYLKADAFKNRIPLLVFTLSAAKDRATRYYCNLFGKPIWLSNPTMRPSSNLHTNISASMIQRGNFYIIIQNTGFVALLFDSLSVVARCLHIFLELNRTLDDYFPQSRQNFSWEALRIRVQRITLLFLHLNDPVQRISFGLL